MDKHPGFGKASRAYAINTLSLTTGVPKYYGNLGVFIPLKDLLGGERVKFVVLVLLAVCY